MGSDKVQMFSEANFEESVIKAGTPVLVDFWAEWCGPCRQLAPTVEALASDYDGRVAIGKLNVDENPAVAVQYSIRGIPALLLFKDGRVVDQGVGLKDGSQLKEMIDKHL